MKYTILEIPGGQSTQQVLMTFAELSNQPTAAIWQMKIVPKETLYDIFIFFKEQKDSATKIYVRTSLLLQQLEWSCSVK